MINIQNIDDNEWFTWCLVRYLNPADHNSRRTTKTDKKFAFTFTNSKKRITSALAFLFMKIKNSVHQNNVVKKNMLTYY